MDRETAEHVLKHAKLACPSPEYRKPQFDKRDRADLLNAGCSDAQIGRLQRVLPGIAHSKAPQVPLADVRAVLSAAQAALDRATRSVLSILDAPDHDEAPDEARVFLLTSTGKLFPERCKLDPQRVSFFEPKAQRYDERADELRRLLSAVADLRAVAALSLDRLAHAPQSRPVSPGYPIALIMAALSVDGPSFIVSERRGTSFERVAARCYAAAGAGSPTRAIRAWLAASTPGHEKT